VIAENRPGIGDFAAGRAFHRGGTHRSFDFISDARGNTRDAVFGAVQHVICDIFDHRGHLAGGITSDFSHISKLRHGSADTEQRDANETKEKERWETAVNRTEKVNHGDDETNNANAQRDRANDSQHLPGFCVFI